MNKLFTENSYIGFEKSLKDKLSSLNQKLNPVHEVVNMYYKINGLDGKPKLFYEGRYKYSKLAREAKILLEHCGGNLEDALWSLDKMKYIAEKKKFDWSIATCLKHDLIWGN